MDALIRQSAGKLWLFWRGSMAICLALLSWGLPAIPLDTGIVLASTRLIYPGAAQNGVTFTLSNHSQKTFLLQSRILPWGVEQQPAAEQGVLPPMAMTRTSLSDGAKKGGGAAPFIILPPLVQFAPNDELTLRIRLVENHLPTDRESLFTLALKAIPSQSTTEASPSKLVLALQNNLKMFYRPSELPPLSAQQRAEKLQFFCDLQGLTAHNPTPYYVTLAALHFDGREVSLTSQRMIAPFASAVFPVTPCNRGQLGWQTINDEGFYTAEQSHKLS